MKLTVLYRGSLSACNYNCAYCPFAKTSATATQIESDKRDLNRFIGWIKSHSTHMFQVFFTPRGETLFYPHYQEAIVELSKLPNVKKVVIQTNLSCRLNWIIKSDLDQIALWCTFHPDQTSISRFHEQCSYLIDIGVRFSVGAVAIHENMDIFRKFRKRLPEQIYFWLNAYKRYPNYYNEDSYAFYRKIDPMFMLNTMYYESKGRFCQCGESVISVYGNGDVKRCHFTGEILGNLFTTNINNLLGARACTNPTCHCHIGYVHLNYLGLYELFKDGELERIPHDWPQNYH